MKPPRDIRQVGENELLITWEDDHRGLYAYRFLRLNCPCAHCVDEWSGRRILQEEKIPSDIRVLRTEAVGRYALKFDWSDGHHTGIYSYEYLRALCPCESCLPMNRDPLQSKTKETD